MDSESATENLQPRRGSPGMRRRRWQVRVGNGAWHFQEVQNKTIVRYHYTFVRVQGARWQHQMLVRPWRNRITYTFWGAVIQHNDSWKIHGPPLDHIWLIDWLVSVRPCVCGGGMYMPQCMCGSKRTPRGSSSSTWGLGIKLERMIRLGGEHLHFLSRLTSPRFSFQFRLAASLSDKNLYGFWIAMKFPHVKIFGLSFNHII